MTNAVETEVAKLSATIEPIVETANTLPMETFEQVEVASDYMKTISTQKKNLEEQRKFFTAPLNEQVKKINALFKTLSTPLEAAEQVIKTRILEFTAKQEFETPNTIGNAVGVTTWHMRIVDETKIPREYLMPDITKLNAVAKLGIKVKGVEFYQEKTIRNK